MKASEWSWVLRNMFAKGSRFYILMVATVSVAILMILRQGDVSACWHSGSGSRSKIRRHREPVVSTFRIATEAREQLCARCGSLGGL